MMHIVYGLSIKYGLYYTELSKMEPGVPYRKGNRKTTYQYNTIQNYKNYKRSEKNHFQVKFENNIITIIII